MRAQGIFHTRNSSFTAVEPVKAQAGLDLDAFESATLLLEPLSGLPIPPPRRDAPYRQAEEV